MQRMYAFLHAYAIVGINRYFYRQEEKKSRLSKCIKKNIISKKPDENVHADIEKNKSTMELSKDDRAIQDINLDHELSKMGLQVDTVETEKCTLSDNELKEILENDINIEEDLFQDNNIDACRIKNSNIREKCIVDFDYVFQEIHNKFDDHCRGVECCFRDLTILGRRPYGMKTKFFFKCRMCNYENFVWSEPPPEECLDVNMGAVAGAMLTGAGYTQLKESCAAMNIPCMGMKKYQETHERISVAYKKEAEDSMQAAAEEERQLALKNNEVVNGIPHIAVIGDGSWMKRSYRTGRYDSLSGVGTIIGARTGKVLHMAVRNKYCSVCERAQKLEKEPANHKCFKNWGKDCSSTSMEADAIVEGFKTSVEKRGLIYSTYIADGDSSVYKKIQQANPYPNIFIQKIECRNHLLRNLCNKVKEVANTKGRFGRIRRIIDSRILRIRTAVTKAVDHRLKENTTMQEKIKCLKMDLNNVISHVFGEYNECAKIGYFCNGSQKENKENYMSDLKCTGLYEKLQKAMKHISWNCNSLLQNKDSNRVETFNSVISKLTGGKRINYGLRGSYETRCYAAVVAFNTREPISRLSTAVGSKAGEIAVRLEETKKRNAQPASMAKKRPSQYYRKRAATDKDYGPQAEKPDASSDEIESRKVQHMYMLQDWQEKRVAIEEETREQAKTGIWRYYRSKMITASHFGHICRMRESTSCAARVKSIVYPQEINAESVKYGTDYEDVARKSIECTLDIKINRCGLFIDPNIPFLGASPDGLIQDDGIIEIKCPYGARLLTPEDAIENNISNLQSLYKNGKDEKMKRSHIYFYQVQGQLHITQRQYCIFALWTPLGLKMEKIVRDDVFWSENMESKLIKFYDHCVLPELLDPRQERNMPIRDPEYIVEAKRQKTIGK